MEIYNSPRQDSGTGKHKPAPRKPRLKIPEKGRIRIILALLATFAVIKFGCPGLAGFFKNREAGREEKNAVAAAATAAKKADSRMLAFDDVRRLISEHDIGVSASRQTVVAEPPKAKGWGKPAGPDTLTLFLSIDTSLQKYAQAMFRRYKPRYAAAAAIDPSTGRVLALASFANEGEEIDGGSLYLKSIFPAASVFKTIVAAAGIEKAGMTAKTPIPHYGRHHTLYKTQLQRDLKASKDITLQDAFAYSVNPAFARIALFNTNKEAITEYGRRFGFHEIIPFEYGAEASVMLSPDSAFSIAEFASGFNRETAISPLLGALIAAAICEGGAMYAPTVVDSVRSAQKDTCVYTRGADVWRRPVKEQTAAELRLLMSKVTHYGTARNTFRPLRESSKYNKYEFGGKTGNVNKFGLGRVDWFVGFARHPEDKDRRIAVAVVTTHGEYWTVQSSYIASELMKRFINIKK